MKTYEGKPGTPGRVTVKTDNGKPKAIKFRKTHTPATISWGKTDLPLAWIALAILDDLMPKQPDRALRLMQRFKWRLQPNWTDGIPWTLSEEEALAIVADIEKVGMETAQGRRMVSLEPTPFVSDRGRDIEWTKEPKLQVNHPARKP